MVKTQRFVQSQYKGNNTGWRAVEGRSPLFVVAAEGRRLRIGAEHHCRGEKRSKQ